MRVAPLGVACSVCVVCGLISRLLAGHRIFGWLVPGTIQIELVIVSEYLSFETSFCLPGAVF